MELALENKVILVTGGASGIGRSISESLLSEGAWVCILDNNAGARKEFMEEAEKLGGRLLFIVTELTREDQCQAAIDQIMATCHRIDGLVNNAGLNDGVSLDAGSQQKFIDSLDKNVGHYHMLTEKTLSHLQKTKGAVVNICSKVALTGQGGTSGYAAANGVRTALTRQWSASFMPMGIRVNGVVVAECATPQYEWWIRQQDDPQKKLLQITANIPLGNRMTSTQEVAAMVTFLLSIKSSGIHGQLLHVDGGYVHLDRSITKTSVPE